MAELRNGEIAEWRNGGMANCVNHRTRFVAANQLNTKRTTHHAPRAYTTPVTLATPNQIRALVMAKVERA
jgi:hypothetical protein